MIIITGINRQTIIYNTLKVVSGLYNGNLGKDSNGNDLLDNDDKNNTSYINIICKRILFLSFDLRTYKFYKEVMRNVNIPYLIYSFDDIDIYDVNDNTLDKINNIYYNRNKTESGLIELYKSLNVFNIWVDINSIFNTPGGIHYIKEIKPYHLRYNNIIINEKKHIADIKITNSNDNKYIINKQYIKDTCSNFIVYCYKHIDTKNKNELNPISFIIPPPGSDIDNKILLKQSITNGNVCDINSLFCTMCFTSLSNEFDIFFIFENKNNHACVCCECMYKLYKSDSDISIDIIYNTYSIDDDKTNNIYISPLHTGIIHKTYIDRLYLEHYFIYYYIMRKRKSKHMGGFINIKPLKINIFR